ncbi:hypothetical protein EBZ39_14555 [bacterium]|nr:hypothetical protein [bacterium]
MYSYDDERMSNKMNGVLFELRITTRVPSKYRLVDLETGVIYMPSKRAEKQWVRDCCQDITIKDRNEDLR